MALAQSDQRAVVRDEVEVPKLGYGTWELVGSDAERGVQDALEIGYRHVDTARVYRNEEDVGAALAASPVARDDVFLTTKLWYEMLEPDEVRAQVEGSLRALRTDYLDLLLIHWPDPRGGHGPALEEMAKLRDEGKALNLGVSNFPTRELGEALDRGPALLANQVEMHPYLDQSALLEMTSERGLVLEAYSPLAHGDVVDDETLNAIGQAHGKSGAQVALRWLLDHPQVVALPRTSSHRNRVANFEVFDFELSEEERGRIEQLARPHGRKIDPSWAPDWD